MNIPFVFAPFESEQVCEHDAELRITFEATDAWCRNVLIESVIESKIVAICDKVSHVFEVRPLYYHRKI